MSSAKASAGPVRVVAQRVNGAELRAVGSIQRGLVIFVSFNASLGEDSTGAASACEKAARAILAVPLLSMGEWGDGSKPEGFLKLVAKRGDIALGVLVVPQANLHATRKGTALSYRAQLAKDAARGAYAAFCNGLRAAIFEAASADAGGKVNAPWKEKAAIDPRLLFQSGDWEGQFSAWDEAGIPTLDAEGKPLSKKRLKKVGKLHAKAVAKWKKQEEGAIEAAASAGAAAAAAAGIGETVGEGNSSMAEEEKTTPALTPKQRPSLPEGVSLVCGEFGALQSLVVDASLGPNLHVFDLP